MAYINVSIAYSNRSVSRYIVSVTIAYTRVQLAYSNRFIAFTSWVCV